MPTLPPISCPNCSTPLPHNVHAAVRFFLDNRPMRPMKLLAIMGDALRFAGSCHERQWRAQHGYPDSTPETLATSAIMDLLENHRATDLLEAARHLGQSDSLFATPCERAAAKLPGAH